MGSTGDLREARSYPAGIHVPSLTWFQDGKEQEVDWELQKLHLEFLVRSGVDGIVIAGTNGEAVTLTSDEKCQLLRLTRSVATRLGRPELPITMGCNGQCTRDVVAETRRAAECGADFALVLTPSYFHFAMTEDAVITFFEELATASPIPVVLYNFPGVVAGLDLTSSALSRLGKHPNIVGVKLTCGGIAKVSRVTAEFKADTFATLAGQSDWLVPALSMGAIGSVTGVANLFPKVCLRICDLWNTGRLEEARELQESLAQMEWGFAKGGINGTKWVVANLKGYPENSYHCRRPYPQFSEAEKQRWLLETCSGLVTLEKKLGGTLKAA